MSSMTLADLAKKMKGIDIAMLTTKTEGGELAGRPMSTNGDVEYDGDSWFFSSDDSNGVQEIKRDPKVALSFSGPKSLLGAPGIFVAVEGRAELIYDRLVMEEHWVKDVERYFPEGLDTPGIVLIKVHATRVHYWDGDDEGEVAVRA
ncbi:pyridoxamine 5'-phosphate oxidase family protein [Mangrovicella endophytica]|uniref:pyridoxamine 5'-phosphate oxidase family protein n=1 Tax=Mangrovicella endophytica TaxID=2066697 RepID=UPI000C9EA725|nr:pyridoxamine 5'-phosphate oxidase family protein [Mangrovicella endophytica]